MKTLLALYLVTFTLPLSVPAVHERCDDVCQAYRAAARAQITSNYRDSHTRPMGVTREQQIKRDRERLALLYIEQARIARAIERTKKGKL